MPAIEAILFDMDGVIIESTLDVAEIKRALFGTPDIFIIEGINNLPPGQRDDAWKTVEQMEINAARTAIIRPEAAQLLGWMDEQWIRKGIVTRNCRASVQVIRERIKHDLGVVIAREDAEPKPAPDGVLLAIERLRVSPGKTFMVGDFIFDIDAGRAAGCMTVFLHTPKFGDLEVDCDFEIDSLLEIPGIITALENG